MFEKLMAGFGACVGLILALLFRLLGVRNWLIFLIFALIGAGVGYVYGKFKSNEEARLRKAKQDEEEKKKRIEWANEIKNKAVAVEKKCNQNLVDYKELITAKYVADERMDEILTELACAYELKGKLKAMADDIKAWEEKR